MARQKWRVSWCSADEEFMIATFSGKFSLIAEYMKYFLIQLIFTKALLPGLFISANGNSRKADNVRFVGRISWENIFWWCLTLFIFLECVPCWNVPWLTAGNNLYLSQFSDTWELSLREMGQRAVSGIMLGFPAWVYLSLLHNLVLTSGATGDIPSVCWKLKWQYVTATFPVTKYVDYVDENCWKSCFNIRLKVIAAGLHNCTIAFFRTSGQQIDLLWFTAGSQQFQIYLLDYSFL